jgi:acyl-CoA thioesterase
MFGGAALAATVAALEHETGRPALWATVQFVGPGRAGDRMHCHVEVLAEGRRTTQARLVALRDDDIVFVANGATGLPRHGSHLGELEWMPEVDGPADSPVLGTDLPDELVAKHGPFLACELRATRRPSAVWIRFRGQPVTPAVLAFVGDFAPDRALRAAGVPAYVTSIDNSIRYAATMGTEHEWVLLDAEAHLLSGGYAHTSARLWAADGELLAVASQTAVLKPRPGPPA